MREILIREEGLRLKPYHDTVGKLTIGVGRNLSDNGISEPEALILLDNDIAFVVDACSKRIDFWNTLTETEQIVLAAMAFQLGVGGLMRFRRMLRSLERGDRRAAAKEMLKSKWAVQTPARARRMARLMEGL